VAFFLTYLPLCTFHGCTAFPHARAQNGGWSILRRQTLRTVTRVAGAIVISLGLAACGKGGREPSSTVPPPTGQAMVPTTHPTTPPAKPSASTGSQPQTRTAPAATAAGTSRPHPPRSAPGCTGGQLAVRVIRQQSTRADPSPSALLTFTNTSRRACSLDGWPAVALTNAADEPVAVPTTQVRRARRQLPVTVRPNRTAFAGLKWTTCEKSDVSCPVGNALRVTPPGVPTPPGTMMIGFPAAETSGITMRSLQISPVQKTTVGATGW
jgi:hypothetical protein